MESGVRVGGDISDGLYREVERFVEAKGFGATIDVDRLPLARGLDREQWSLAVNDSEDFELVCAGSAPRLLVAQRALARLNLPLTVVGEIERRPGIRLRTRSGIERLEGAGYEHFH